MFRRLASVPVVLAAVLAATLAAPATAVAAPQTCTQTSTHCRALARLGPPVYGFHGAYGRIHEACLYNSNYGGDFSTTETWLYFGGGAYWIEAGIAVGLPQGARKYFFWADQRPGGGYHEHDEIGYLVDNGTYYNFTIAYAGSSNFSVSIGPTGGTSTAWGSTITADRIETGTETSGGTASIFASSSELGYINIYDQTHNGWTCCGGTQEIQIPSNWGYIVAKTVNSWYKYGTVTNYC